jgi:hypothetical protein
MEIGPVISAGSARFFKPYAARSRARQACCLAVCGGAADPRSSPWGGCNGLIHNAEFGPKTDMKLRHHRVPIDISINDPVNSC